jgi:hypothetical protein
MVMNHIIDSPQIVDLGLSSRWSSCNLGANSPEELGDYYAWGEIEPKRCFDRDNYRWFSKGLFPKYGMIGDSARNNMNILTELDLNDDVAHVMLGGTWRIPSMQDMGELYKYCDWEWTTMQGINGCRVSSLIKGYTDCSIFFPAAGCIFQLNKINLGLMGYYWLSAIYKDNSKNAIITTFDCHRRYKYIPHPRFIGMPIRPVCD